MQRVIVTYTKRTLPPSSTFANIYFTFLLCRSLSQNKSTKMLKSLVFVVFCLELLQCASVDKKDRRGIRDKKLSDKEHFHEEGEEHDMDYDHEAFLGMYFFSVNETNFKKFLR